MIHQAIHYIEPGLFDTPCGRVSRRVAITGESSEVTCKQCLHKLNAPKFVGQNRNRQQFELTCSGGPWDGEDVVLPRQEADHMGSALSLPIRVGEHVGRYNLNTGTWVPKETKV